MRRSLSLGQANVQQWRWAIPFGGHLTEDNAIADNLNRVITMRAAATHGQLLKSFDESLCWRPS
jgi:hypothetical protein